MTSFLAIGSSLSLGKGLIPERPNLSHGPVAGTFIIDNYDSSLRYVLTAGSRTGNTITLGTSATVQCNVVAYTQKGVVSSASRYCERKTPTQSYVQVGTEPGSCSYLPFSCNCCAVDSGGLCIFCSGGGPIYGWVPDPLPAGYTASYGEWWKIV